MSHFHGILITEVMLLKHYGKRFEEYMSTVKDVMSSPSIQRLENYDQHMGTSRLQHSINVSYKSFVLARLLGWDYRAAARAGLMHDMFYYNFRDAGYTAREHCRIHPQIALRNARCNFSVSERESDIISAHMLLTNWKKPKFKETYLIVAMDNLCALEEVIRGLFNKFTKEKKK